MSDDIRDEWESPYASVQITRRNAQGSKNTRKHNRNMSLNRKNCAIRVAGKYSKRPITLPSLRASSAATD